jgi:centromeric protein E
MLPCVLYQKKLEIKAVAPKSVSINLKEEITRLHSQGSTIASVLEEQLQYVQKSSFSCFGTLIRDINLVSDLNKTWKDRNDVTKCQILDFILF